MATSSHSAAGSSSNLPPHDSAQHPSGALPPGAMRHVILLAGVAALGGFLFGYDSGVINGTVEALQKSFQASDLGSGFNVASMLLGCAAGAFLAGGIADKFGRRAALFSARFCSRSAHGARAFPRVRWNLSSTG